MAQNRDKLGMELPKTSPKRANSEVTELRRLKIQVTLRIKNRSEMRQLDNRYIGKVTRMRLEGVLKDFFNDRWVKEGVVFDIEVVSQYE